jgi:peptidoglycan hydrolase-like protein with peptidoglycan-binding domain
MKRALGYLALLAGLSTFVFAQSSSRVEKAQSELKKQGYDVGKVDGIMGPKTKSAVEKYQSDKKLNETGTLDAATMRSLQTKHPAPVTSAAKNLGGDTKTAGHDIKTGHPIEAGKDFGEGAIGMGKSVGHETKIVAKTGEKKVHHGMDVLSKKIYGTTGDDSKANTPNQDQNTNRGAAVGQPATSQSTPK